MDHKPQPQTYSLSTTTATAASHLHPGWLGRGGSHTRKLLRSCRSHGGSLKDGEIWSSQPARGRQQGAANTKKRYCKPLSVGGSTYVGAWGKKKEEKRAWKACRNLQSSEDAWTFRSEPLWGCFDPSFCISSQRSATRTYRINGVRWSKQPEIASHAHWKTSIRVTYILYVHRPVFAKSSAPNIPTCPHWAVTQTAAATLAHSFSHGSYICHWKGLLFWPLWQEGVSQSAALNGIWRYTGNSKLSHTNSNCFLYGDLYHKVYNWQSTTTYEQTKYHKGKEGQVKDDTSVIMCFSWTWHVFASTAVLPTAAQINHCFPSVLWNTTSLTCMCWGSELTHSS